MTTATDKPASDQLSDEARAAAAALAAEQKLIEDLRSKYPDRELRKANHPDLPDWIIFKVPNRAEYRIYRAKRGEDDGKNGKRWDAFDMLLNTCVVWPEKDALQKQLDGHPGLIETWVGEILQGAGQTFGATQKKL